MKNRQVFYFVLGCIFFTTLAVGIVQVQASQPNPSPLNIEVLSSAPGFDVTTIDIGAVIKLGLNPQTGEMIYAVVDLQGKVIDFVCPCESGWCVVTDAPLSTETAVGTSRPGDPTFAPTATNRPGDPTNTPIPPTVTDQPTNPPLPTSTLTLPPPPTATPRPNGIYIIHYDGKGNPHDLGCMPLSALNGHKPGAPGHENHPIPDVIGPLCYR